MLLSKPENLINLLAQNFTEEGDIRATVSVYLTSDVIVLTCRLLNCTYELSTNNFL